MKRKMERNVAKTVYRLENERIAIAKAISLLSSNEDKEVSIKITGSCGVGTIVKIPESAHGKLDIALRGILGRIEHDIKML